MLRSCLCDYSDTYILVGSTITITGGPENPTDVNQKINMNKTEIHQGQDLNVVILMYNLIEYSNYHSKTSGRLWPYYSDEPASTMLNSKSFKSKITITEKTSADDNTKYAEITVP